MDVAIYWKTFQAVCEIRHLFARRAQLTTQRLRPLDWIGFDLRQYVPYTQPIFQFSSVK